MIIWQHNALLVRAKPNPSSYNSSYYAVVLQLILIILYRNEFLLYCIAINACYIVRFYHHHHHTHNAMLLSSFEHHNKGNGSTLLLHCYFTALLTNVLSWVLIEYLLHESYEADVDPYFISLGHPLATSLAIFPAFDVYF